MAKPISPECLVSSVESACGTIAGLLIELGKSVGMTQLPMAAECSVAKVVLGRLGVLLAYERPDRPDGTNGRYHFQVADLVPCFEVILQSISEILLDVDHEITRLRRYRTRGDPLASSKLVPVVQDFFRDAKFGLRRSRSSLCLMIDCLQR